MRHYRPDRHGLTTLRVLLLVLSAVLILTVNYFVPSRTVSLVIDIFIASVSLIAVLIYLPLYFSSLRYTVTDTEIISDSGVILRFHQAVKITSVQYTAVISSPFSRLTGLNFVLLFVYGGQMNLMFLKYDDMLEISALAGGTQ
ncbi:MAG: PH domain-containing protein [Ruminococcus sp.]|nr:PH domain-containing protein [Ruminococcus sp.]